METLDLHSPTIPQSVIPLEPMTIQPLVEPLLSAIPLSQQALASSFQQAPLISIYIWLPVLLLVLLFAVLRLLRSRREATKKRDHISIVGARGVGKTQLWMTLANGKSYPTVPSVEKSTTSIVINSTDNQQQQQNSNQIAKQVYTLTDYFGDQIALQDALQTLQTTKLIIIVVDGKDKNTVDWAADAVAAVWSHHPAPPSVCPSIILLINNYDTIKYLGQSAIVSRLQQQLEGIRKLKKLQQASRMGMDGNTRGNNTNGTGSSTAHSSRYKPTPMSENAEDNMWFEDWYTLGKTIADKGISIVEANVRHETVTKAVLKTLSQI